MHDLSIEELPERGDICELPSATASSRVPAPEEDLFSQLRETPVYAQESGGTVEVRRPPVRDIFDTAPISRGLWSWIRRTRRPETSFSSSGPRKRFPEKARTIRVL